MGANIFMEETGYKIPYACAHSLRIQVKRYSLKQSQLCIFLAKLFLHIMYLITAMVPTHQNHELKLNLAKCVHCAHK